MFAGALALVATITPAVAFAHGGGDVKDGRSIKTSGERRGDGYGKHSGGR